MTTIRRIVLIADNRDFGNLIWRLLTQNVPEVSIARFGEIKYAIKEVGDSADVNAIVIDVSRVPIPDVLDALPRVKERFSSAVIVVLISDPSYEQRFKMADVKVLIKDEGFELNDILPLLEE